MEMSKEEVEREKHLIESMDMPYYPLLSVVKRDEQKSGIIIAGDNVKLPLKIYIANIFNLKDDNVTSIEELRSKYQCIEFESIEKFLEDGWRVD